MSIIIAVSSITFIVGWIFSRQYYRALEKRKKAYFIAQRSNGLSFESSIAYLLEKIPGYKKILTNLYLFYGDERTELDVLLIHETGFYIMEAKNYSGWIYGNGYDAKWTQTFYQKKFRFTNPIHQNYHHVQCLKKLLNIQDDHYLKSYIIFGTHCQLKKIDYQPSSLLHVLKIDDLWDVITTEMSVSPKIFTKTQIDLYEYKLSAFTDKQEDIKKEHVARIQKKYQDVA